jgi:hypothetical protein
MLKNFTDSLTKLKASSVTVLGANAYHEPGMATVQLLFSEGAKLRADYWRVIRDRKEIVSSFDHQQKYGLPAPRDAIKELQKELRNKTVTEAHLDKETGDLLFRFNEEIKLQIFGFSGYEVWEISFSDGTGEYSNYVK